MAAAPERMIWRLTAARHTNSAFDGEGARRYGGRWNRPGTRMVYCSSTLALAVLEVFVHLDPELAPPNLVAIPAVIPAGIDSELLEEASLPTDWRSYPAPERLRDLGTNWVRSGRTAVLSVPSCIVPHELNVLLNPAHPDFSRIHPGKPEPFSFDPRMWK